MENRKRLSPIRELNLYLGEYQRTLFRNWKNLLITLAFPLIAMMITVWIAGENMFVDHESTKSACFVLISAAIWCGLFNSIQVIVKERSILRRNMISSEMRVSCYTASRAILQLVLCLAQSAILSFAFLGVKWIYGNELPAEGILFRHTVLEYFVSLFLLTYAADSMGLLISSVVRKSETASNLAPYILIVQLLFSGILFPLKGFADAMSYTMLSRWGMEALGSTSQLNILPLQVQKYVPTIPHEAEDMFQMTGNHLGRVWGVLLLFSVGFFAATCLLLPLVKKDSR